MQIIYDSKGTIYAQGSGLSEPEGSLAYINISIPDRKYVVRMDTSKDPVEPILEEYPKTEVELMKEQLEQQQADLDYLKLLSGDEEV